MQCNSQQLSYAAAQARAHDRDRFLIALALPPVQREALWALLAWNVEISRIPETASEPLIGHIRFTWWRETLEEIAQGRVRAHPVAQGLSELMQKTTLTAQDFFPLIDAREKQWESPGFATLAALEEYAAITSGGLIGLSLRATGQWDEALRDAVRHLGIAWALGGMLRSLAYLAAQNRSPFPHALLQKHGVVNLQNASEEAKHRAALGVTQDLLQAAQQHLQQVELPLGAPKLLRLYHVAARHYLKILHRNRRRLMTLPPSKGRGWLAVKLILP